MPRTIALTAALLTLLAGPSAAFTRFAVQTAQEGDQTVASLVNGGEVVLRWRGAAQQAPEAAVRDMARMLNEMALQGLAPSQITVAARAVDGDNGGAGAAILLKSQQLLLLDRARAGASNSLPADLARLWADRLREIFKTSYIVAGAGEVKVPVGETRSVKYGGQARGDVTLESSDPVSVTGSVDPESRQVTLRAMQPGQVTVTLRCGEAATTIAVDARKWAARVLQPIVLGISGPTEPNRWLYRAARIALLGSVRAEPGARARVGELSLASMSGEALISAGGSDYFGFQRRYPVSFSRAAAPRGVPTRAILSNDPERVPGPQVLARTHISGRAPVNLLWHHAGAGRATLDVVVRLTNYGRQAARLHAIGADGGPSADEVFAGHAVMSRFVRAWRAGAGSVFEVPPGHRCELSRLSMPPETIVSGLARLALIGGEDVVLDVVAEPKAAQVLPLAPVGVSVSGHLPRVLELPGHKRLEMKQRVGQAWRFLHIGKGDNDAELHPRLRGDYGVVHDVDVVYENDGGRQARLELALRAGGGAARAVLQVNGQLVETGMLVGGDEVVLYRGKTNGAAKTKVTVRVIPQSGSNYPMTLIARSFAKEAKTASEGS